MNNEKKTPVWGKVSHNLSSRWAETYGHITTTTVNGMACLVVETIHNPSVKRTIPMSRVHYIDDMGSQQATKNAMLSEASPWLADITRAVPEELPIGLAGYGHSFTSTQNKYTPLT